MTNFLLREYYRWSTVNILHLFISWGVLVLSYVVLGEPLIMIVSAASMILTYFLTVSRSRFSYLSNCFSTAIYSYMTYHVGLYATSLMFTVVMLPIAIGVAVYVFYNKIYMQDFEKIITSRGTLSTLHFLSILGIFVVYIGTGLFVFGYYGLGIVNLLDLMYSFMFPISVALAYYSRYEFKITNGMSDSLALMIWGTIFLTYDFGFSMILATLIGFSSTRLVLVWWVVNKKHKDKKEPR